MSNTQSENIMLVYMYLSGWWFHSYFLFPPRTLGKMNPFWRAYFSKGLKPPTSCMCMYISLSYLFRFYFYIIYLYICISYIHNDCPILNVDPSSESSVHWIVKRSESQPCMSPWDEIPEIFTWDASLMDMRKSHMILNQSVRATWKRHRHALIFCDFMWWEYPYWKLPLTHSMAQ